MSMPKKTKNQKNLNSRSQQNSIVLLLAALHPLSFMHSSFINMSKSDFLQLPEPLYWKDRLTCKGCTLPLVPPIVYCSNTSLIHPLCKNCSQCNVSTCKARIGTQRSTTLEKILTLVSFTCEFKCSKGPFKATEYRNHLSQCHLRPLCCIFCQKFVPYTGYVSHLATMHNVRESPLDKETLILNFSETQPRIQIVRFGADKFLVCFANGKLWVEYFGIEENAEVDYHVRVAGVKYDIDFDMKVVGARCGGEIIQSGGGQLGDLNRLSNKFIIPPKDEELFLLFIQEDDNDTISSISDDLNDELLDVEKISISV